MSFSFAAYPGIEKLLLLSAALVFIVVVAACFRLLQRAGHHSTHKPSGSIISISDQDPNSLTYSGVGPGFQGFGIYAGGVRVAHDHIESD